MSTLHRAIVGLCLFSLTGLLPLLGPVAARGQEKKHAGKDVYTGTAVGIGGDLGNRTIPFTLEITGYTPEEAVPQMAQILETGGQDALLKALSKQKLGYFAFEGRVGRDLNFVRKIDDERDRKLNILFERWLRMYELRYGTRSEDYQFSYIELSINDRGKGEGTFVPAAKVRFNKKKGYSLEIEDFGVFPARLMGVELRK
jgi:hypothetical protein